MKKESLTAIQKAQIEVRRRLENDLGRGGSIHCEGRRFDAETGREPHLCVGQRDVNEVLFTRRVFQKLPASKRVYFYHEFNCSIVCRNFHQKYGHSRTFREWFEKFIRRKYGDEIIDDWLRNVPLKIKLHR